MSGVVVHNLKVPDSLEKRHFGGHQVTELSAGGLRDLDSHSISVSDLTSHDILNNIN